MTRYPDQINAPTSATLPFKKWYRIVLVVGALIVTLSVVLLVLTGLSNTSAGGTPDGFDPFEDTTALSNVWNKTLGFQKLIVITDPSRSDRRDTLSVMGAATGLHFEYIDAVDAQKVPDSAMPPGAEHFQGGARGAWRAHMNALRKVVEEDLTSAVILEDDIDWDVRLKQQMNDFALSSKALLQPLLNGKYADPTYPKVRDVHLNPPWLEINRLPRTKDPETTPYGDNWDILWLGHCGMIRSVADDGPRPGANGANPNAISKGVVVHRNDPTTPHPSLIHVWDDGARPNLQKDFPSHTRVVQHAQDGVCTFAYAVSQAGARKILYELGIWKMDDGFDMMLRMFCDGIWGHERHVCLTVEPSLFSHYTPIVYSQKYKEAQRSGMDTEFPKEVLDKESFNIRWSTRMNLQKLVDGQTDYVDQWPDR